MFVSHNHIVTIFNCVIWKTNKAENLEASEFSKHISIVSKVCVTSKIPEKVCPLSANIKWPQSSVESWFCHLAFLEVTALRVQRQCLYLDSPCHGQIAHLKAASVFFLCLIDLEELIRGCQRHCRPVLIVYSLTGGMY